MAVKSTAARLVEWRRAVGLICGKGLGLGDGEDGEKKRRVGSDSSGVARTKLDFRAR
jgi:hypothetical protein